jgi:hypothetical protein
MISAERSDVLCRGGGKEIRMRSNSAEPVEDEAKWTEYEVINAAELATRLGVPKSWIEERVRTRAKDKIPHARFGKYVRFTWGSPDLEGWLRKCIVVSNSGSVSRVSKEKP